MHRSIRNVRARVCVLTLAALGALAVPAALGAQEVDAPNPADESPVATPFVGEYPMWCTDRNPSSGTCATHHGSPAIDVGMEIGTPIHAAGAGIVLQVEADCAASWCRGGAGLFVEIGHPDGTSSRYLHLSELAVSTDDEVVVGQVIGLAGNSGSSVSPHLHYDEHFPRGRRTPFGPWLSCIDGRVVEYPTALGYASWNDVPFGTMIRNDGFDCLPGATIASSEPDLYRGPELFAVAAPRLPGLTAAEIEITTSVDEQPTVVETIPVSTTRLTRIVADPTARYEIRQRIAIDGSWRAWSAPVLFVARGADDEPTCRGLFATGTEGTDGIDVLIGTDADDRLDGGPGADILCGAEGHDTLIGGAGDDWIVGGPGRDELSGGPGRDRLFGGSGRDSIDGGDARDRIVAGPGADTVAGGSGSDVLVGSTGDDVIRAESGKDRVRGGHGDDELHGGGGNDRLAGNDGTDVVDGGSGLDVCDSAETTERCE